GVGGSGMYPYGSTSAVRAQVLAALGVLKLATADQMHRLMAPGHKDNKAFRNAALDLARHGLAVSEGSTRDGNKLWNLTPLGLDAAAEVLGRPVGEMGGTARGAARSGAPRDGGQRDGHRDHPHACHGDPACAAPVARPDGAARDGAGPAPGLVLEARGMGWIGTWSTEVPLSLPTSRGNRAAPVYCSDRCRVRGCRQRPASRESVAETP
ncbi:hypothetical protein ACH4PR_55450, partial [Streptomyces mirabilis]